jgi:hypothetical protein
MVIPCLFRTNVPVGREWLGKGVRCSRCSSGLGDVEYVGAGAELEYGGRTAIWNLDQEMSQMTGIGRIYYKVNQSCEAGRNGIPPKCRRINGFRICEKTLWAVFSEMTFL